ncbi:MAG: UvrD-helicase domain-containing protein [Candidatus Omnitrophica bacterium]|nr:UvrD-helicase domain-containing protein [Candidatus Omnitrophota bacterium]MDD3987402.1 UvrD-helicase domain-containing protein [Candidatus Omnitrophota bacterium]MDD5664611.1 UvrD-helicase domain-containing protein [Candidatus Omnitrophota bacterium]
MNDKILDSLNDEQLKAVTHREGPLLIIAGAGTGKTRVISRRISWLIAEGLAKTDEILALTFTDKAAREMQERVDILLPYGYTDIWISTFHAFGDKLLRENAFIAGLNPDFKVLTQAESAVFFREHLFEFNLSYFRPLAEPTRFIEAMISFFSRAKDEDISPEEYFRYAQEFAVRAQENKDDAAIQEEAQLQMEVARAYIKYQELLARESLLDFGNQFYMALELLRKHPAVLKKYQGQFKYILVDEFQDTNFAQFQIIKILAAQYKNITVVADDDQCIYRWRGAAYSNILNFDREFPNAEKISLIQNYRSTQPILDSAYRLIQNNNPERFEVKANINKRLSGVAKEGRLPQHLHFDTLSTEADNVAKIIKDKVASKVFRYRDFAILVRSNSDAESFLQALNMQSIPWQFSGNQGLYTREEVRLCINFLRVIANPSDSLSLYYLASCEIYPIKLSDLSLCSHYARRRNKSLYSVFTEIGSIAELESVSPESKEKIAGLLSDIDRYLNISRRETTGRLLYAFLSDSQYLKRLTGKQSLENESKIQNLAKFFNHVRDFELVAKEDRVMIFVNYLNLLIEAGDDPPTVEADLDSDAVNVLTIHKAKGLEFRVVFLVSLVQGRFPWPRRSGGIELPDLLIKEVLPTGDFHIQEERRLFYVGMTRAKEELYLTSAEDYGGKRLRKVSQFVLEALGQEVKDKDKKKVSAIEAIERFAPRKESVKIKEKLQAKPIALYYYQIDDYKTCPLKYKYVNILRVPIMEHHTVIYGRAMHDAVSKYYQYRMSGRNMSLADILNAFRVSFDPQGFIDLKHQEERLCVGEAALTRFFKDEQRRKVSPKLIEEPFNFKFKDIKITGRFDRVDEEPEGAVIMDFKTSEIKHQKDADKRVKTSSQLRLYSLAYQSIFGRLPKRVALYFLESGIIGSREISEEDLDEIKEDIVEVAQGIGNEDFKATPAYMACAYCAYNQICPSAKIR